MLATGKGWIVDLAIDAAGLIPGGRAAGKVARGADAVVRARRMRQPEWGAEGWFGQPQNSTVGISADTIE